MANINATRYEESAQKKVKRVLTIKLVDLLFTENNVAIATNNFLVANLPSDSVLTDAYVSTTKVSDAATTATVQLGTAEAGAQILVATSVKTVAVAGDLVGKLDTGTGMPIYMRVIITGAVTTIGEAFVTIEYTEYAKNSGEYTQFS